LCLFAVFFFFWCGFVVGFVVLFCLWWGGWGWGGVAGRFLG